MYFGSFKALLIVTPSLAKRSVTAFKSAPGRGKGFSSSATATGTMETDKPESDVTSSDQAVCDATKPEAGAGNGEARAEWPWKRAKKVAVMISFAGKNYFGMQR